MSVGAISQAAFDRIGDTLTRALSGLSREQITRQPAGPESNPIGWIAWHLARVHDTNFSNLLGTEQAWKAEGWAEKFGLSPETKSGGRSTLDEVRAFDPVDADTLIAYWQAARTRSRELLDKLQEADLDKPTPAGASAQRNETYKITIARVTSDAFQHVGQICYARGLVDRHGWYGA
jgi:hypothetical protein